ncbi:SGNH/GDSL hydrolase family protein [Streptomyces sp. ST2-7A]|uniref:SGNH/GDSL hydrolase family protein n=1 Tax=Streptomyces sp. ST2-7A TaxID=2907214 RepID=UPI001F457F47|nr:SGNH/GDSL hydrolase family protein [Streptomyces sp. ST2-7A]MCE7079361.1 SGNH/GDSL hydrolase family protein [Streptomyces sp. ST2-7A]
MNTVPRIGGELPSDELRYVALGDSLTEGIGDPLPDGTWRGWAALLADALATPRRPVRFERPARSGARCADVAERQLPPARRFRPHLASVLVGGNDTLRTSFDIHHVARSLDTVVGGLVADGAVVVTACLPDPGRLLGLPGPLARPLARRMRSLNEVVHTVAARHGALHLHLADHPMLASPGFRSVDRLHPGELGHRLLAREVHTLLSVRDPYGGAPPSVRCDRKPPGRVAATRWMATKGTRWVLDRSRDLLPGLLGLAVEEARHRVAGTAPLLDRAAEHATRAALGETGPAVPTGAVRVAAVDSAPRRDIPGRPAPTPRSPLSPGPPAAERPIRRVGPGTARLSPGDIGGAARSRAPPHRGPTAGDRAR